MHYTMRGVESNIYYIRGLKNDIAYVQAAEG